MVARRIQVLGRLLVALALVGGCAAEEGGPTTVDPAKVEFPEQQLEVLRQRIVKTLAEIDALCQQHGITEATIRNAFNGTDWNDPTLDRFSAMPEPIRKQAISFRDDMKAYYALVVEAYDRAEGREPWGAR